MGAIVLYMGKDKRFISVRIPLPVDSQNPSKEGDTDPVICSPKMVVGGIRLISTSRREQYYDSKLAVHSRSNRFDRKFLFNCAGTVIVLINILVYMENWKSYTMAALGFAFLAYKWGQLIIPKITRYLKKERII